MTYYYVETIKNKRGRDTILLRQSWREGQRIRKQTLANLTDMPRFLINGIDAVLRGGVAYSSINQAFRIARSLPHGHVAAVLGTARTTGLERILHRTPSRQRSLALAAVVSQVIAPDSKLATAKRLSPDTADSTLGEALGLGAVNGNEMLSMLDWLLERQRWIEKSLANRHLHNATLILYDVTSSYLEGRNCPLASFGYSRDGKKGKMQIVFGMLCAADGCPVAVEVFRGNTADPSTLSGQVKTIQQRFGIRHIALVGDRSMITTARIKQDLKPAGLDWISALRTDGLRKILDMSETGDGEEEGNGRTRIDSLKPDGIVEVSSDEFPGETIMVCLNARLRSERARKREALLLKTEQALEAIARSARLGNIVGKTTIARKVGAEVNRWKMAKHFEIHITEKRLRWKRLEEKIAAEASLDGIYAIRTSVKDIGAHAAVCAYKSLCRVERAFRSTKSVLNVRPIYVYSAGHAKAHVFLCMLAYYVEWHMRRKLAPLLFEDDDPQPVEDRRPSPVAKAEVSESAKTKSALKQTADGHTAHSFATLLDDLSTISLNSVLLPGKVEATMPVLADLTPLQMRAMELLGVNPQKYVPSARTG